MFLCIITCIRSIPSLENQMHYFQAINVTKKKLEWYNIINLILTVNYLLNPGTNRSLRTQERKAAIINAIDTS